MTPVRIGFATYDGSGQVVHPDVVSFPEPWNGHRLWTVLTPYPGSAVKFENPSVYASDDGDHWVVPDGATNPLMTTGRGYLSDPDMVFQPDRGELWLYYREVQNQRIPGKRPLHFADHVWLTTSADAVHWSTPRNVASDTGHFVVSPSILRTPDGEWRMFEVNAGRDGCSSHATHVVMRRSTDGVKWSAATPAGLAQPGYMPWHLDVQYIASRHEYWALVAAFPSAQGCTATSLFLATSTDGSRWVTYPTPVLARGAIEQFSEAVYRSTLVYAPDDSITIWYSGARKVPSSASTGKKTTLLAWSAAVTRTTASELFGRITNKSILPLSVSGIPGTVIAPSTVVP